MGLKHAPHMCRDGHPEIQHFDSEHEMCPLCRVMARRDELLDALQDLTYVTIAVDDYEGVPESVERALAVLGRTTHA